MRAGEDLGRAVTALLLSVSKILREREPTRRSTTSMAVDSPSPAPRYPETLATRTPGARRRTLTSIFNVAEPTTTTALTVGVDSPPSASQRFSKPDEGRVLDDLRRRTVSGSGEGLAPKTRSKITSQEEVMSPTTGSETERPFSRTLGRKAGDRLHDRVHPADRAAGSIRRR